MGCLRLDIAKNQEPILRVIGKNLNPQKMYINYYPFGMEMPGRSYSSSVYRYGFQGQEKDDEIKGKGNSVNYKYRMHDVRSGRFFAVDPLAAKYPYYSQYAFSGNRVIDMVELEGLEPKSPVVETLKKGYYTAITLYKYYQIAKALVVTTEKTIEVLSKYEVSATADFSLQVTVGAQGSLDVKNFGGFKGNFGAVELVKVTGTIDLVTGKMSGDINYFGKNNEIVYTAGVLGSVPLEFLGIPASISGEISTEKVKDQYTEELKSRSGEIKSSVGAIIGAEIFTKTTKSKEDGVKNESGIGVGGGASIGLGLVGEVKVDLIKVTLTKIE